MFFRYFYNFFIYNSSSCQNENSDSSATYISTPIKSSTTSKKLKIESLIKTESTFNIEFITRKKSKTTKSYKTQSKSSQNKQHNEKHSDKHKNEYNEFNNLNNSNLNENNFKYENFYLKPNISQPLSMSSPLNFSTSISPKFLSNISFLSSSSSSTSSSLITTTTTSKQLISHSIDKILGFTD